MTPIPETANPYRIIRVTFFKFEPNIALYCYSQDIEKYRSLFPYVSAAIQLSNNAENKCPTKGDTIQYIYTNLKHNNPLCRVVPLETLQKVGEKEKDSKQNGKTLNYYDKDKYREMILDAAETVLRLFGFDRTVYGMPRENRKGKWYQELHKERTKDIQTEIMMEK